MSDEVREVEMRIVGLTGEDGLAPVQEAVRQLDPSADVRIDGATGIVHITTRYDTLEIVAALTEAGFEPQAETM